jgi:hypothetical protein
MASPSFTPVDKRRLTSDQFVNEYLKPRRPVVIAGLIEQWPAWNKWSFEFFRKVHGALTVPVRMFESGRDWEAQGQDEFTLAKFIDEILASPWTGAGRAPLIDWPGFFDLHPELCADLPLDGFFDNWLRRLTPAMRARHDNLSYGFVLMGPQNAVYNLHYDYWSSHAVIAHLVGRKRIVLYPPDQRAQLYNGRVDVDKQDFQRFPRFREAKGRMEGILEPGDLAFVPSRWWHQVSYCTACLSVNSFVVNDSNVDDYVADLGVAREMDPSAGPVFSELADQLTAMKARVAPP